MSLAEGGGHGFVRVVNIHSFEVPEVGEVLLDQWHLRMQRILDLEDRERRGPR
jgi:hypothetical protein